MHSLSQLVKQSKSDGAAAMALSHARLYGVGCRPDPRAAFNAVRLAAHLGHPDGRRARIYMTAAGIGTTPDQVAAMDMLAALAREDRFAALQLSLLDHVASEQRLAGVVPTIVSRDPYIALYPGLFSAAECKYLSVLAAPWLEQALVSAESGGERFAGVRDADSSPISHLTEDLIVQRINRVIAAATDTQPEWGEPLNVLRYREGQQYRPHHDGRGTGDGSTRIMTALIWLNGEFEGGETDFPRLDIRVRGGLGDMLVFRNTHDDGSQDDRMIHAGLPVRGGVKWLASRWIRGSAFLG